MEWIQFSGDKKYSRRITSSMCVRVCTVLDCVCDDKKKQKMMRLLEMYTR